MATKSVGTTWPLHFPDSDEKVKLGALAVQTLADDVSKGLESLSADVVGSISDLRTFTRSVDIALKNLNTELGQLDGKALLAHSKAILALADASRALADISASTKLAAAAKTAANDALAKINPALRDITASKASIQQLLQRTGVLQNKDVAQDKLINAQSKTMPAGKMLRSGSAVVKHMGEGITKPVKFGVTFKHIPQVFCTNGDWKSQQVTVVTFNDTGITTTTQFQALMLPIVTSRGLEHPIPPPGELVRVDWLAIGYI